MSSSLQLGSRLADKSDAQLTPKLDIAGSDLLGSASAEITRAFNIDLGKTCWIAARFSSVSSTAAPQCAAVIKLFLLLGVLGDESVRSRLCDGSEQLHLHEVLRIDRDRFQGKLYCDTLSCNLTIDF